MPINAPNLAVAALLMRTAGAASASGLRRASARGDAAAARTNAQRADLQADDALRRGGILYGDVTRKAGQLKGAQRAALAANGIDLAGSDTAMAIQASTDYMKEVDANTILANAMREAMGYRAEATDYRNQALISTAAARAENPWAAAGTELLSGAGQVAEKWSAAKRAGTLTPRQQKIYTAVTRRRRKGS